MRDVSFEGSSVTRKGGHGLFGYNFYHWKDHRVFDLVNFGGRQFISGRGTQSDIDRRSNQDTMVDYQDFKQCCQQLVKKFNQQTQDENGFAKSIEVVHAITTSLQPSSEGYLETLGFKRTRPYPSSKYSNISKVSFWFMPCEDFLNAIE